MRVGVPQNKSSRLCGKGEDRQTPQVDPGWHKHPAQQQGHHVLSQKTQRVGWLVPREDKVDGIDDQCSHYDALRETPQSQTTPCPKLCLVSRLFRRRTPAEAENECSKTEEQKSCRKLGKQCRAKGEAES